MSGFLDRLAGLATGRPVEGSARVALPSRFAPVSSAPLPNVDLDTKDDVSVVPKSSISEAVRGAENAAREFAPVRPLEESREGPLPAASMTARIDASPVHLEIRPAPAEPPHVLLTPKTGVALAQPPVRARTVQESPAPMLAAPPPQDPSRIHPPLRAGVIAARDAGLANRAPLNADILAARPQAARNVPPPIHVTIDRIDVRVASPAKTVPPPTRARRGPSQSLAEYLRRPRGGGEP